MITIGNKNFFWEPGTCFRYSLLYGIEFFADAKKLNCAEGNAKLGKTAEVLSALN